MTWGSPTFVLAIIAISTMGWVLTTAIRARYGYPVEGEWGGTSHKVDNLATTRQIELLSSENAALTGKIARLEERLSVLERIATDRPRRLEEEIDALR